MIEIKPAEINDLPVVQKLAYEIWPSAYLEILGRKQLDYMLEKIYSLSSLQHQFSVLKHQFVLAFDNLVPVGFASFSAHKNSSVFHLNKIYVLPGLQGKNIGKQILHYVISEIKKSGATALQLNVNRHNRALHFYEKQGFKIIREEDIDIGSGYFMNDYVMELTI
ncbi:MAG: GNAT family N-acetyltransferase [Ginsengibacter sp.]